MTVVGDYRESNERFSMHRLIRLHTSAFVTQSSSHASGTAPDFPIAGDHRGGDKGTSEWLVGCSEYVSLQYVKYGVRPSAN